MKQGKIIAIITGAISVLLAVAYLILVQLLDFRGEMLPPSIDSSYQLPVISDGGVVFSYQQARKFTI